MFEMHKRVASVTAVPLSDETTSALLTGATVIELANSGDFYEDGGSVRIAGNVYTYSAVEEGEDDDAPVPSITLDSGLLGNVAAQSPVEVWNPDTGAVVVDYMVEVTDDTDGSTGTAYLRHDLIPYLPEGLPPGVGDSVTVTVDDLGDWWVTNVHGRRPFYLVGDPNGKRVMMVDNDGSPAFEAYDATNVQTVNIDGEENFMQGTIATDADDQPRVEVGQGSSFGQPAQEARFYTGHVDELDPAIISVSTQPGGLGEDFAIAEITAPQMDPSEDPAKLLLRSATASGALAGLANLTAPAIVLESETSINLSAPNGVDATLRNGTIGTGTIRDSVRTAIGPVWTSYAGSITTANVTVGNGTLAADYLQNGKLVHYRIKLTFGSTTALTGSPTFTLPVAAVAARAVVGGALMFDSSAALGSAYKGGWVFNNTVNVLQVRDPTSAVLSATVPFTWATGDELVLEGYYESA